MEDLLKTIDAIKEAKCSRLKHYNKQKDELMKEFIEGEISGLDIIKNIIEKKLYKV